MSEKTTVKPIIEHYRGIQLKIKYDLKEYEHEKFTVETCGKKYDCEIKFNHDRHQFQALIRYEGKTNSLSFFPIPKNAKDNIYMWIGAVNGQLRSNEGVGD